MDTYLEFTIPCEKNIAELLVAELSECGFDAFTELEHGIIAYVQKGLYDSTSLYEILEKYLVNVHSISQKEMEQQNNHTSTQPKQNKKATHL